MSFDLRRSKQTIFGQSTDFLIGELLLKAGIIKQNQLDDALKLAGNKHMQIGQMLIMARYITPKELQAALDAQAAIKNHTIELNSAIKAIALVHRQGLTFAEASQKQSQETSIIPTHKLGQLLLEANFITSEQFSVALQKSMAIGLPLGRILILNNVLTEALLSAALEALIKLRDGLLSREEAVAYLSDLGRKKDVNDLGLAGLEEASQYNSSFGQINQKGIRLGEFFVLAGILSETDVMNALEFSLVNERSLGEMLLEHGYVNANLVDSALKLQSLIQTGSMDCMQAARCLNHVHTNSMSLTDAIELVNSEAADGSRMDFQTLLLNSNIITTEGIQSALELAVNNPRILAKILTQTGYLSEDQSSIMLDCHEAIIQNNISPQDAAFVLDYCLQKLADGSITFVQGLQELGWTCSEPGQDQEANQAQQPQQSQQPNLTQKANALQPASQQNIPAVQSPSAKSPRSTNANPSAGSELFNSMLGSAPPANFMSNSPTNQPADHAATSKTTPTTSASSSFPNAGQASQAPKAVANNTRAPSASSSSPNLGQASPPNTAPKAGNAVSGSSSLPNTTPKPGQTFSAASSFPNAAQNSPAPNRAPTTALPATALATHSTPVTAQALPTANANPHSGPQVVSQSKPAQPGNSQPATATSNILPTIDPNKINAERPLKTASDRPADKSLSLRSLLKDDPASSTASSSSENSTAPARNGNAQSTANEGLDLSDSEKALIMQASSLTASPEEIMAAMQLAAKKDKTIQSQD